MTHQEQPNEPCGRGKKGYIPSQEHWQVLERLMTDLSEAIADSWSLIKKSMKKLGRALKGSTRLVRYFAGQLVQAMCSRDLEGHQASKEWKGSWSQRWDFQRKRSQGCP